MNGVSEPVKNLKLCQAFLGHNPVITDCTEEIADTEFYIEDSQEIGYTVKVQQPTQDKICKVFNPSQDTAILLPIDNRFIKNNVNGIADAAVFNTKDFHFVEFKTNAEGNSDYAVAETYKKAMEQLKETLNLFESKINAIKVDFRKQVNVECNFIVSETFPRNKSAEMSNAILFAQQTSGIPLGFDNEIELR